MANWLRRSDNTDVIHLKNMKRSNSLSILKEYMDEWGILLPAPLYVVSKKRWLRCIQHRIIHDSDECAGLALIELGNSRPSYVDFRPLAPTLTMLPPWAAYPDSSAVWGGWRQGSGDGYLSHWRQWLADLPTEDRREYLKRYPAPDDERLWLDWLESLVIPFIPSNGG